MKGDLISIEETKDSLKVWHHGILVHNYHGMGLESMVWWSHHSDILYYVLQADPILLADLLKQLRLDGLFKPEDKEKPLS